MSRTKALFSLLYRSDCVIFFLGPTLYKKQSGKSVCSANSVFQLFGLRREKKGLGGSCRMKTKTLAEFAYSHIGKCSLSLDDLLVVGPIDAVLTRVW